MAADTLSRSFLWHSGYRMGQEHELTFSHAAHANGIRSHFLMHIENSGPLSLDLNCTAGPWLMII